MAASQGGRSLTAASARSLVRALISVAASVM